MYFNAKNVRKIKMQGKHKYFIRIHHVTLVHSIMRNQHKDCKTPICKRYPWFKRYTLLKINSQHGILPAKIVTCEILIYILLMHLIYPPLFIIKKSQNKIQSNKTNKEKKTTGKARREKNIEYSSINSAWSWMTM